MPEGPIRRGSRPPLEHRLSKWLKYLYNLIGSKRLAEPTVLKVAVRAFVRQTLFLICVVSYFWLADQGQGFLEGSTDILSSLREHFRWYVLGAMAIEIFEDLPDLATIIFDTLIELVSTIRAKLDEARQKWRAPHEGD